MNDPRPAVAPRLDFICLTLFDVRAAEGRVISLPRKQNPQVGDSHKQIVGVPQLYWSGGEPWHEANLWASERASLVLSGELDISTIQDAASSLLAYMRFLESSSLDWRHFPKAKADRCLTKFRGALIRARDAGDLAASTATSRMAAVVRFYRWVKANELLTVAWGPFEDRVVHLKFEDAFGLARSIAVQTTDLAIPNRRRQGVRLEDGLRPVSLDERDWILSLAKTNATEEFHLMLSVGFGTGMRLGSICDLKIRTLQNARPHPLSKQLHYLSIGPGIRRAPVHTKFGVTGEVIISTLLLEELRRYVNSPRRLKREAKAAMEHKALVFLTKSGRPYSRPGTDRSSVINVEMTRLKRVARAAGHNLSGFRFHYSRATFATSIADTALTMGAAIATNVVGLIRDLLLQKDEATAMKYIKFVREQKVKAKWANEFTRQFIGRCATEDAEPNDD